MRAPELSPLFATAMALLLMSALDFCLFTTIWEDPKELDAARFAADILEGASRGVCLSMAIRVPEAIAECVGTHKA